MQLRVANRESIKMVALPLLCFLMLPGTVPQWPWHTNWVTGLAGLIALIAVNACIMSNRKSRFIALTTTLQIALMPFYIGIYLAVISPTVTLGLCLALGTLMSCIRCSVYLSMHLCCIRFRL